MPGDAKTKGNAVGRIHRISRQLVCPARQLQRGLDPGSTPATAGGGARYHARRRSVTPPNGTTPAPVTPPTPTPPTSTPSPTPRSSAMSGNQRRRQAQAGFTLIEDPGGAIDSGHHVRPRLRHLPRCAHLRGAHRRIPEALARDRVRHAHDGAGFCGNGATPGARYLGSDRTLAGAAGHGRGRHPERRDQCRREFRFEFGNELRRQSFSSQSFNSGSDFGGNTSASVAQIARSDPRGLVEYGRPTTQHPAARVLFAW